MSLKDTISSKLDILFLTAFFFLFVNLPVLSPVKDLLMETLVLTKH